MKAEGYSIDQLLGPTLLKQLRAVSGCDLVVLGAPTYNFKPARPLLVISIG
jgi:hypothetical protein